MRGGWGAIRPTRPRIRAGLSSRRSDPPRRRCRRSHAARRERGASVRELLEEAKIVLVEQPDVLDLIFENRNPLDADAPREAVIAFSVVADPYPGFAWGIGIERIAILKYQ